MGNNLSVPSNRSRCGSYALPFAVAVVVAPFLRLLMGAALRERARSRRLSREKAKAVGRRFYNLKLTIKQVEDLVDGGFLLEGARSADAEAASADGLSIVSFLGYFNTGKTSLVARLCETGDSPAGDERHTEGLSMKITRKAERKLCCVDTEGLATPLTDVRGVTYDALRQRRTLEDFQRELAAQLADCVVFVCDKISYRDQMDVYCLLDNDAIKSGKRVIVVHNLRNVRDVGAMTRYQGEVFRMYDACEVQWDTVDGVHCGKAEPIGPGPHRLGHTKGHYNQLTQVFLGDEDEPTMRRLNAKTVDWLRTTLGVCARYRHNFSARIVAAVKRMVPSYFMELGDVYDVHLVKDDASLTDDVQRVKLVSDGKKTAVLLPRDLTGIVPRKKTVKHTYTDRGTYYVLTFSVSGVSCREDVTGFSVKAVLNDRVQIVFNALAPVLPLSACPQDAELAETMADTGTRGTRGPNDVVHVDRVMVVPFWTGQCSYGAGAGVVWVRLEKIAHTCPVPQVADDLAPSPCNSSGDVSSTTL